MDSLPYIVGSLLPLVIFGCLPAYFLDRSFRVPTRSAFLANLSLGCGLAMVIFGEILFSSLETNWSRRLLIAGFIHGPLAQIGIGLAITAFLNRRDGGVTAVRPLLRFDLACPAWGVLVVLLFEGPRMQSKAGKGIELGAMKAVPDSICLSVN